MKLSDRPFILVLAIMADGKSRSHKEIKMAFGDLVSTIHETVCDCNTVCHLYQKFIKWFNAIDTFVDVLVNAKSFLARNGENFVITELGRHFYESNKAEVCEDMELESLEILLVS